MPNSIYSIILYIRSYEFTLNAVWFLWAGRLQDANLSVEVSLSPFSIFILVIEIQRSLHSRRTFDFVSWSVALSRDCQACQTRAHLMCWNRNSIDEKQLLHTSQCTLTSADYHSHHPLANWRRSVSRVALLYIHVHTYTHTHSHSLSFSLITG